MTTYYLKQLDETAIPAAETLFVHVFEQPPWCDDWSDKQQLRSYMYDLMGQSNSLTFGLYEGEELVGLSMGRIKHWYSGTEYYIDELCICTEKQGQGLGTLFVREIERACKEQGLTHLFLLTESDVPAYKFYKKQGFCEVETNVGFVKKL